VTITGTDQAARIMELTDELAECRDSRQREHDARVTLAGAVESYQARIAALEKLVAEAALIVDFAEDEYSKKSARHVNPYWSARYRRCLKKCQDWMMTAASLGIKWEGKS